MFVITILLLDTLAVIFVIPAELINAAVLITAVSDVAVYVIVVPLTTIVCVAVNEGLVTVPVTAKVALPLNLKS